MRLENPVDDIGELTIQYADVSRGKNIKTALDETTVCVG